jgi:hypothetical protein
MDKISHAQVAGMMKLASENLRGLSEENQKLAKDNVDLKEKVAHFEKKAHAEKIAKLMEDKGINTGLDFHEKVASIMDSKKDLSVIEEAVSISAPQTKLASVAEDGNVVVEGGLDSRAEDNFASALMTDE